MQQGFFYDFSNYGTYDRLTDDGLTQWHPAFFALGRRLEECAAKYRGFCRKYKPQPKPEKRSHWGSKLLGGMNVKQNSAKSKNSSSPGQLSLPWNPCQVLENPEVQEIAEKFVRAYSLSPLII